MKCGSDAVVGIAGSGSCRLRSPRNITCLKDSLETFAEREAKTKVVQKSGGTRRTLREIIAQRTGKAAIGSFCLDQTTRDRSR